MDDLKNLRKTLGELKKYLSLPIQNDRDRAGIIQALEFTFEQAWKAIQKTAFRQGVEIGNPKKAFSYAMQNGWIGRDSEPKWLQLLKDRNLTSHTYEELLAKAVLARIQNDYVGLFDNLLRSLEQAP